MLGRPHGGRLVSAPADEEMQALIRGLAYRVRARDNQPRTGRMNPDDFADALMAWLTARGMRLTAAEQVSWREQVERGAPADPARVRSIAAQIRADLSTQQTSLDLDIDLTPVDPDRALCPRCGRSIRVRADGAIRVHSAPGRPRKGGYPACVASGMDTTAWPVRASAGRNRLRIEPTRPDTEEGP
jgi:hypothetical protein